MLLEGMRLQASSRFTDLTEPFKTGNTALTESSVLPAQIFHWVGDMNSAKYGMKITRLLQYCLTALMFCACLCTLANLLKL